MSKYTAEQARMSAKREKRQIGDSGRYPDGTGWGHVTTENVVVLSVEAWEVIDAILRERESAKAVVTDALKVVLLEHHLSEWTDEDGNPLPLIDHLSSGNTIKSGADEIDRIIDAVEEAVAPMLASARVAVEMPAEFGEWFGKNYPGPNKIIGNPHWHAPRIWRAARRALLAAAPKTEEK